MAVKKERVAAPITAGDFKKALSELTEAELALPIMVGIDDEHEFLTMTVSHGFDHPIVKLLTSERSGDGHSRIRVIRLGQVETKTVK
jgi:hypothetical protein